MPRIKVKKTETIERINESEEGSMQNVGKLKQLLSTTIHLFTICRILIAVPSLKVPPSPSRATLGLFIMTPTWVTHLFFQSPACL